MVSRRWHGGVFGAAQGLSSELAAIPTTLQLKKKAKLSGERRRRTNGQPALARLGVFGAAQRTEQRTCRDPYLVTAEEKGKTLARTTTANEWSAGAGTVACWVPLRGLSSELAAIPTSLQLEKRQNTRENDNGERNVTLRCHRLACWVPLRGLNGELAARRVMVSTQCFTRNKKKACSAI